MTLSYLIIKDDINGLHIKVSQKCDEGYLPIGRPFKTGIVYHDPRYDMMTTDAKPEFGQAMIHKKVKGL